MDIILVIVSVLSFLTAGTLLYLSVRLSMLEDQYHITKLTKMSKVALACAVAILGIWMSAVMYVIDGCK